MDHTFIKRIESPLGWEINTFIYMVSLQRSNRLHEGRSKQLVMWVNGQWARERVTNDSFTWTHVQRKEVRKQRILQL